MQVLTGLGVLNIGLPDGLCTSDFCRVGEEEEEPVDLFLCHYSCLQVLLWRCVGSRYVEELVDLENCKLEDRRKYLKGSFGKRKRLYIREVRKAA